MKRLCVAAMIAAFAMAGCESELPKPPDAVTVEVATAEVGIETVPDVVQTLGSVEPVTEAVLSPRIMGVITELAVREGDPVKAGQTVAVIDAADIAAKKREAEQARAEGMAALAEAEAALGNAETNLGRMKALYDDDAVTKKELDDAETGRKMAGARVDQVRAKIKQAEASVEQADVMLGYSVIKSPIGGVVISKTANKGEVAAPGMPLVKVADDSRLRMIVNVKESELASVKKGDRVDVRIDALEGPGQKGGKLKGRVGEVVPSADPATRSFTVKIDLPRTPGVLPGMSGRAFIPVGTRQAVLLPAGAVLEREGLQGAFVVTEDGGLMFQPLRLGAEMDGSVEVLSGLKGGERVAVGELDRLRQGMRVKK